MNKIISHFLLYLMIFDTAPALSFTSYAPKVNSFLVYSSPVSEKVISDSGNAPVELPESVSENRTASRLVSKPDIATTQQLVVSAPMPAAAGGGGSNVETFTGDFSYSIPVMNVEGFPITLNYNSEVMMNQEASWVGFGWNLDLGRIAREVRGIPDDFNGSDQITRQYSMLADNTDGSKHGTYAGIVFKKFPWKATLQLTALWGSYKSSYLGLGKTHDFGLVGGLNIPLGKSDKGHGNFGLTKTIGYSSDSKQGAGINQSWGISAGYGPGNDDKGLGGGIGAHYGTGRTSRGGLQNGSFTLSGNFAREDGNDPDKPDTKALSNNKGISGDGSVSATTSITYGTRTAMPRATLNTRATTDNFTVDTYVTFGNQSWRFKTGAMFENYSSTSEVVTNSGTITQPALGYLHSGKRHVYSESDATFPLMDFERGNDYDYSTEMKNLPFSVQTFDIFHVGSPLFAGTFRPGRTDIGTYYDPATWSTLNDGSELLVDDDISLLSVGYKVPITVEVGYSTGIQQAESNYHIWDESLSFQQQPSGNAFDPTTYFKAVGECTPNPDGQNIFLSGTTPIGVGVSADLPGKTINSTGILSVSGNTLSAANNYPAKPVRATSFHPFINSDLATSTDFSRKSPEYLDQAGLHTLIRTNQPANHIGAVEITTAEGMRLNYDLPVYTVSQNEVVFSVTGRAQSEEIYTDYIVGTDNSTSNGLGRSHYYDKSTVPAHPTEFLLTRILSGDYVDLSQNGPTIDDVGSYYKIDYTRVSSGSITRFPYAPDATGTTSRAYLHRGFLGSDLDDLGQYSYTESEVFYPFSVEGKTMIAVFELENRLDAYYAIGENGGSGDAKKLLRKIKLYNLDAYRFDPGNATPLQTVEFVYDYLLCANTPMSTAASGNKLTLTDVKFYSGAEKQVSLSSYHFGYSTVNPPYVAANSDGWGNYKVSIASNPNYLSPYCVQDELAANENAKAWKLTEITQPGGGTLELEYEADRYSYVQKHRAMVHNGIAGMMPLHQLKSILQSGSWDASMLSDEFTSGNADPVYYANTYPQLTLSYGIFDPDHIPNNVLLFELPNAIPASNTIAEARGILKQDYFTDANGSLMNKPFVRLYAQVKETANDYELIPVFGQSMSEIGLTMAGIQGGAIGVLPPLSGETEYSYGYIVLDIHNSAFTITAASENANQGIARHPFQQYCIDFARQNLPDKVYGSCDGCDANTSLDNMSLFSPELYEAFILAGYLPGIDLSRSSVRLFTKTKFGGGSRVKSITVSDDWENISGEDNMTFETSVQYDYDQGMGGVNSSEPRALDDESPLYEWATFVDIIKRFPDQTKFHVKPISAQLLPQPAVGYARVISKTLDGAKGWGESVYYTAYDFPYVTDETDLSKDAQVIKRNIITGKSTELYGFTQGYSVISNDFHGKLRSSSTYDPLGNAISSTSLAYYGMGEKLPMIDRRGNVTLESVSREFDAHLDSRISESKSMYRLVGLTIAWTPLIKFGFIPMLGFSDTKAGFYSNTFVKHTNYSAVVKSVETNYLGSENSAENLLYDYYTGIPLLTSLKDEYNDKLYSFNYPSHWAYPELREIEREAPGDITGSITGSDFTPSSFLDFYEHYQTGDQITLTIGSTPEIVYISSVNAVAGTVEFIYGNGVPVTSGSAQSATISLLPANKANLANRLAETMESAVTKKSIQILDAVSQQYFPIENIHATSGNAALVFPVEEILGASAIDYRQKVSVLCSGKKHGDFYYVNPFTMGGKGKLYLNTQYSWQEERLSGHHHGTRFDGAYATFTPFYSLSNSVWLPVSPLGRWKEGVKPVKYDIQGNIVEVKDPLGISAATLYGYNPGLGLLPVASADNAKNKDIAFDCFEDYAYEDNYTYGSDHFSFASSIPAHASLNSIVRHSGTSSLQVPQGQTASQPVTLTSCDPVDEGDPEYYNLDSNICACAAPFDPTPGMYLVSTWIKQTGSGATARITLNGNNNTDAVAVTPVIDGWQKFETRVSIPAVLSSMTVSLVNESDGVAYFDDFRIHPYRSNMSTTVYDPTTLIPVATHDSENFTTFYNYDENNIPVRVRVETIEGIKTVSESQSNIHR